MKKNKKAVLLAVCSLALIGLFIGSGLLLAHSDFMKQFRSFRVTVANQSNGEITVVELGIAGSYEGNKPIKGDSRHQFMQTVGIGEQVTLKPDLALIGEGAVYMEYTGSQGQVIRETVCGYTESLTGFSEVAITNTGFTDIVQKCW
ncbi:hypothetical protein [Paenibacillus donghaensis]|uniref:Uncharacterized protein n=1 Tax=Paenibacillus donghaensis TaxID=414771 RepID=A0A2Z2KD90_9BACL|nr:hypothetical protein [Paenibacillus donghaensis]ASA24676.1 hypothetical protein B9T62_30330 [Paenibacillus donghaensis]